MNPATGRQLTLILLADLPLYSRVRPKAGKAAGASMVTSETKIARKRRRDENDQWDMHSRSEAGRQRCESVVCRLVQRGTSLSRSKGPILPLAQRRNTPKRRTDATFHPIQPLMHGHGR